MQALYRKIRSALKENGIENPDLEARIVMKHVLHVTDAALIAGDNCPISKHDEEKIDSILQRRINKEPLSRILGEREFWGLSFKVTQDVLDPRPDTETLVEAALKRFKNKPPRRILDMGTGSGCILIALLHEWPQAQGVAVDISQAALDVAQDNARRLGVVDRTHFVCGDWSTVRESFDLVVSNPPYIPTEDILILDDEVRNHDPTQALDGGSDGLAAYEAIFREIKNLLFTGGSAFFEIGINQLSQVQRLAENTGLHVIESYADLAGIPRVVEISLGKK